MSLAVLSDEVIRELLETLSHDEAEGFAHTLKCALHDYSTGTQSIDAGLIHQPKRTSVTSNATGATTLFMPSCSPVGHGVKANVSWTYAVVTVSSPHADPSLPTIKPTGSVTLYSPSGSPLGFLHAQTLTAFRTALASSCLLTKRASVRTITVFGSGLQAYWHIRLALMLRGRTIRTVNIINRRFSDNAKTILKQFYAVPAAVKQREGWTEAQFSMLTPTYGEYSRLQKEHIREADVIYCCTPSTEALFDASILTSHEGRRKGRLIVAVGSYTTDMRELPRELLLQATKQHAAGHMHYHKHATEGGVIVVDTLDGALKEAGEIIDAELEPKQLVELGELVMIHKLREDEDSATDGSSAISNSFDKLDLSSSGPGPAMSTVFGGNNSSTDASSHPKRSSSRSPSRPKSSSSRKGSFHLPSLRRGSASSQGSSADNHRPHKDKAQQQKRDDHLARWLSSGNVIYKSVGLGLVDLVVGLEVVRLARERGVGSHVENFSSSTPESLSSYSESSVSAAP
ncbi:Uu.00g124660.m01.CDS01 [Anthostomella pinea]|uniref:Uu.00g124660.m01.CDS01 n=1 Tax=Anthostomella pinea TaxID=933095 RepID=A0AAI8YHR7_9PEZI|nr:Uu.00g124660.m01.CDS01 [Anthostomella pinea]